MLGQTSFWKVVFLHWNHPSLDQPTHSTIADAIIQDASEEQKSHSLSYMWWCLSRSYTWSNKTTKKTPQMFGLIRSWTYFQRGQVIGRKTGPSYGILAMSLPKVELFYQCCPLLIYICGCGICNRHGACSQSTHWCKCTLIHTQHNIIKHVILLSNIYWQYVFFCGEFSPFCKKKKGPATCTKDFLKKMQNFVRFWKKEIFKLPHFYNRLHQ